MAVRASCLVLFRFFGTTYAAPIQPRRPTNRPPPSWSNEAIVGLVSLFVAVLGISITLIASPKMRRNIRSKPLSVSQLRCPVLTVYLRLYHSQSSALDATTATTVQRLSGVSRVSGYEGSVLRGRSVKNVLLKAKRG
jgi:hypothetical protein